MNRTLLIAPLFACLAVQAAPGFKQTVAFPAFEAWAKGASLQGFFFKEGKDEAEAYLAHFKGGAESLTVKIEGAGKFEGLALGAAPFTWKGLEARYAATGAGSALIALKYGDAKATLSLSVTGGAKARSQAELEKLLAALRPEKILK